MRKNIIHILSLASAFALTQAPDDTYTDSMSTSVNEMSQMIGTIDKMIQECQEVEVSLSQSPDTSLRAAQIVQVRNALDINRKVKPHFEAVIKYLQEFTCLPNYRDELVRHIRNFDNSDQAYTTEYGFLTNADQQIAELLGDLSVEQKIQEISSSMGAAEATDPQVCLTPWELSTEAYRNISLLSHKMNLARNSLDWNWSRALAEASSSARS